MIEIKKANEPKKLLLYRSEKEASYEEMDAEVKKELLEALLREQGHICAYCMKKIPEKRELLQGVPKVAIEHWLPRNPDSELDVGQGLDYKNMMAVCSGNRGCGSKKNMTCDARKGNERIKVNPCEPNTLQGITYTSSGLIQSSDEEINADLNERLNLNCEQVSLPENRKQALKALIDDVSRNHAKGDISLYCRRKLDKIREMQDPKLPFVGILIWWLERHI